MAITRALLPKQLHAGAPDLRLTGDQRNRGTYTQRRRDQMAYGGIAGLDGRMRYGLGSWFQKKIKDPIKEKIVDPVLDLVTDNKGIAALTGGALLNQFGIPFTGTGAGDRMGQNWLGELLGKVPGVGGDIDLVLGGPGQHGQTIGQGMGNLWNTITGKPNLGGLDEPSWTGEGDSPYTGELSPWRKALATVLPGGDPGYVEGGLYNKIFGLGGSDGSGGGLDSFLSKFSGSGGSGVNWQAPLAIGLGIGAADAATRKDHQLPEDRSINIPQTAQAAMDDPNLRFKPPLEYTQLAADGGRIGYNRGRVVNPGGYAGDIPNVFSDEEKAGFESMLNDPTFGQEEGETTWEAQGGIRGENPNYAREVNEAVQAAKRNYMEKINSGEIPFPNNLQWQIDKIGDQTRFDMWEKYKQNKAEGGRIGYEKAGPVDLDRIPFNLDDIEIEDMDPDFTVPKPSKSPDATPIPEGMMLNPFQTMEFRDSNHNGIEDRAEGIYLDRDFISKEKFEKWKKNPGPKPLIPRLMKELNKAEGGRIGFNSGGFSAGDLLILRQHKYNPSEVAKWKDGGRDLLKTLKGFYTLKAQGGRIGAQEGGLMDLGGMEKDYRQEGGFVPIGGEEKADDVPARLSKNEFVFTADAVRSAGGGDIDEGAAVMERLMENLEAGGKVSEESQGLEGAREMFATTQRLEKRIA